MTFTFEAEVRLLRWSESSTAGRTITLEIPPDAGEAHPFRGLPTGHQHGQRFRMAFIAIDDNEEPRDLPVEAVGSRPPEPASSALDQRADSDAPGGAIHQSDAARSGAERRRYAAFLRAVRDYPRNPDFQKWVAHKTKLYASHAGELGLQAADYIRYRCGVPTRLDIKTDEAVCEKFLEMEAEFDAETPGRLAERRG